MKYSVVIPTLNEEKYIGLLLEDLRNQTFKDFEVVVVDGNSTDKTKEVVESFMGTLNVKFLTPNTRGAGKQRNYGAKNCSADTIIFIDADVKVTPNLLTEVDKNIKQYKPDLLTAKIWPINGTPFDNFVASLMGVHLELVKYFAPGAYGAFICTTRELFNKLNGFNEQAVVMEDFDFALRAYKNKFRYYLMNKPLIHTSLRRAQKVGRTKMIIKIIANYTHFVFKGPILKDEGILKYEFGNN